MCGRDGGCGGGGLKDNVARYNVLFSADWPLLFSQDTRAPSGVSLLLLHITCTQRKDPKQDR